MSQYPPTPPGQVPPMGYPPPAAQPSGGLAIASMILGIVSVVTFCIWCLSVPCGVVAIVLGFLAKGKIAKGEATGAGKAKAGLILGIIGVVLGILFVVLGNVFAPQLQEWSQQKIRQMEQQQPRSAPTR